MATTATLSTSIDFVPSAAISSSNPTSSSVPGRFTGTLANGTNEFAAYIANGTSIPDSQFDCPVQYSGLDYVDIPWLNMSVEQNQPYDRNVNYYDGYCGIKGAHPRMAYCCQNMQAQPPFLKYPDLPTYLAPDHCSQYCRFFPANLNYWLWCLTQEGDLVSNAFCRWDDGKSLSTSGSLSRDGPFDPDGYWIEYYRSTSPYCANSMSLRNICVVVLMANVLLDTFL
ncbi:hypothetical protein KC332_g7842 [Hortaea werneckii]|uniref:Uncharacterized protein n=1 Tax=Hortaea werneckii TaxID=91943 RepID=A0A3M7I9M4_HORWE|nr:hypothetical protein KC358_g7864 [Hortaea werneckii]KAI6845635.1 hypothetical protein KC350_g4320 [Hortaea werneckii]KAI6927826.1 hypothetical protein KC348_g8290 [Hortaea werneckii]KAI6940136.1 hypothetical protein KC341_g3720 [Hortaea werneckii]KAI6968931.1 hypothetical protein KC321_g8179 [Hortaea werneckii]